MKSQYLLYIIIVIFVIYHYIILPKLLKNKDQPLWKCLAKTLRFQFSKNDHISGIYQDLQFNLFSTSRVIGRSRVASKVTFYVIQVVFPQNFSLGFEIYETDNGNKKKGKATDNSNFQFGLEDRDDLMIVIMNETINHVKQLSVSHKMKKAIHYLFSDNSNIYIGNKSDDNVYYTDKQIKPEISLNHDGIFLIYSVSYLDSPEKILEIMTILANIAKRIFH